VPDRARYAQLERLLRPGRLLEIGPGGGHFLAAAREKGHEVTAVELSPKNRAFIDRHWGITVSGELIEEDRQPANHFQSVVSFNCIEHVLDPVKLMTSVRRVLAPGGVFVLTTCSADSLLSRLPGGYWTMCKQPDHVSIGGAKSFTRAAARAGLGVREVFFSEYPLETPLGVLSALRDAWRERRSREGVPGGVTATAQFAQTLPTWANWLRTRLQRWEPRWSPANLTSRFGVSSTIGIQLERPSK